MSHLKTAVYKKCAEECGDCEACKSFSEVVRQIDLSKRSESERFREHVSAAINEARKY